MMELIFTGGERYRRSGMNLSPLLLYHATPGGLRHRIPRIGPALFIHRGAIVDAFWVPQVLDAFWVPQVFKSSNENTALTLWDADGHPALCSPSL